MVLSPSAIRQSNELAAKAAMARAVRSRVLVVAELMRLISDVVVYLKRYGVPGSLDALSPIGGALPHQSHAQV
jgi:hypothetical protein